MEQVVLRTHLSDQPLILQCHLLGSEFLEVAALGAGGAQVAEGPCLQHVMHVQP